MNEGWGDREGGSGRGRARAPRWGGPRCTPGCAGPSSLPSGGAGQLGTTRPACLSQAVKVSLVCVRGRLCAERVPWCEEMRGHPWVLPRTHNPLRWWHRPQQRASCKHGPVSSKPHLTQPGSSGARGAVGTRVTGGPRGSGGRGLGETRPLVRAWHRAQQQQQPTPTGLSGMPVSASHVLERTVGPCRSCFVGKGRVCPVAPQSHCWGVGVSVSQGDRGPAARGGKFRDEQGTRTQ